jgi:probable rRNA maturation factor
MKDDPDPKQRLVIDVAIRSPRWRRRVPGIERLARDAARAAIGASGVTVGAAELSLVLDDDDAVRELNRRWRGRDGPTNVLSFPAGRDGPASGAPRMLGDVVLGFATVAREAEAQGKTLADHARHLIVHGVLHLLGHDHERRAAARRMEALERRVLARLGVADPYVVSDARHG